MKDLIARDTEAILPNSEDVSEFVAERLQQAPPVGSRADELAILKMKGQGKEILPLQGAPALVMPPHIVSAHLDAASSAVVPPTRGLLSLRHAIADMMTAQTELVIDPETEVAITNGAMHGAYVVFSSILDPGDEVIIPAPSFFLHETIRLVGGRPVLVPMHEKNEYELDLELIEKAVTPRTKAFLLITPQNPTGNVPSLEIVQQLGRLAEKHKFLIISDESFRRYVYDDNTHTTTAGVSGLRERTITVRSFTKTFALGPWRVGYIVASPDLLSAFAKTLQWMNLSVSYVVQKVAEAAINGPQDWLAHLPGEYQRNRDEVYEAIGRLEAVSCVKPQGGPLLWLNISRLGVSPREFANDLLLNHGIPSTVGDYFHSQNPHVRLVFGGTPETISTLNERLADTVGSYA